jgi:hypothetical protein
MKWVRKKGIHKKLGGEIQWIQAEMDV